MQEDGMDAQRFDRLVKILRTRRSALGFVAGFSAFLNSRFDDAAAKKCKKKCGPCKRCKKGKCKPKPGSPGCGPCRVCQGGRCVAQCSPDQCVESGGGEVCLRDCDPPCDTCSSCDRLQGQCELMCQQDECVDGFCRVACDPPCGDCSVCDFGFCEDLCPDGVACDNNLCQTPCSPDCSNDEECIGGECFPVCDPPCNAGQGCVSTSQGNACVALSGDCTGDAPVCRSPESDSCSANNRFGRCASTSGGLYCASGLSCSACETDVDCQSQGFGPNSRCATDCPFCFGNGGMGCMQFVGDAD